MSVTQTMSYIAAMFAEGQADGTFTADQLRTAYSVIPRAVQDAMLPAIVTTPADAQYDLQSLGEQMVLETRLYFLDYLYSRVDVGTTGESEGVIEGVLTTIRDFVLARPGLWRKTATQPESVQFDSEMLGDTGYIEIVYAGERYVGVRYRLQVREINRVQYVG